MKTATVSKPAAKTVKPAPKPAAKVSAKKVTKPAASPIAQMATQMATREQIRAARYPKAAAAEAAKKAEKAKPASERKQSLPKPKNTVAFVPKSVKKGETMYAIAAGVRPSSGGRMYAHTHAVLAALGLLTPERHAVSQGVLTTMIGQSAVTHHRKQHNFEDAPSQCIRLSDTGRIHFMARLTEGKFDTQVANAFADMIVTGKIDPKVTGVDQNAVYAYRA